MPNSPHPSRGRASSRRRGSLPPEGDAAPAGRSARRGAGRRRGLKIVALASGFVVLLGGGAVAYAWHKLNGNIRSSDLFAGSSGDAGKEKADAFGRTPINILMIGSDNRSSKADCKLGGSCGGGSPGQRADVEMVVHISADRSNATVMSIPRDLETGLPGCTDKEKHTSVGLRTDAINSALNWGPGCSVAAVHQLTGIPIDHFMEVDFAGVVKMSDAVGGVHTCVSDNVYDPYSHLKLSKGGHTLKGVSALEFLRTRHGFGTGDDPGRTVSQHLFLTSLINKLKSAGTLTDPTAIWGLSNAATKSLTVDNGLDGIQKLISLADDINKVPTKRITFTTMQNVPDTVSGHTAHVLIGPGAQTLFSTIANDQPLTTSSGAKSSAASATATAVPTGQIAVQVENGTGIGGRAGQISQALLDHGFSQDTTTANGVAAATTALTYPAGQKAQAKAVGTALGLPHGALKQGTGTSLVLLIGADWPSGTSYPGGKSTPAPADTKAALGGASAQTGDSNHGCAKVSHFDTVAVTADGRITTAPSRFGITPIHAYDVSPKVKVSAP